jgi:Tol biopolymer transport system component
MYPFWSPDSQSVGFFTSTQLRRLDIGNGLLQTITNAPNGGRGGTWSEQDVILFGAQSGPLVRVPATGGASATVTTFTPGQNSHRFPHFLPGGRQFVFYAMGAPAGIHLGSLDSPATKRLASADTSAEFVLPNWLLFLRQGTLVARRLDLALGELTGDQVSVADQVSFNPNFSVGAFSVSSTGSIAYRTGNTATTQLTWVDTSGKTVGTLGEPDANGLLCPTLSPDQRRVVAYRSVDNNVDLWLFEAGRMRRLTSDPGRDAYPVWSPNGDRIVFAKDAKGSLSLYQKASSGGPEELLLESPSGRNLTPQSWSRDGKYLLYLERDPARGGDLWVLPMDGKQKKSVFVNSGAEERAAQFSPDGRWVAYSSDESNRTEIYVRPFPPSSGQWTVSTMGGVTPRWRDDGKELYYIAPDGMLMAVSVAATGTAPEMGTPRALFPAHAAFGGANIVGITWQYDVGKDGRFLINVLTGEGRPAPITVIQHWTPKK